ncbi:hypothetical protein WICMUC_000499 [Wickerhamomyces mucosus]|uniref:Uncharacterized protein n=1 Tax=Wickerhamomyces mucosus TaxID=1378264 RepID=A0A9P8PXK6_9ASCO|nr:hypothetical protein WICMUC_000499 [Wickerhamomyces mucosus]
MLQKLPHEVWEQIINQISDHATLRTLAEIKPLKQLMSKFVLVIKVNHSDYGGLYKTKVIENDEHFTHIVYSIKAKTKLRKSTGRYSKFSEFFTKDITLSQYKAFFGGQLDPKRIFYNSFNDKDRPKYKPVIWYDNLNQHFAFGRPQLKSGNRNFIDYRRFRDNIMKYFKLVIIEVQDIQFPYPNAQHLFDRSIDPSCASEPDILYRQPLIELGFPIRKFHSTNWIHLDLQEELNVPLNDLLGHIMYQRHFADPRIENSALMFLFLFSKNPLDFKLSYNSVKRQLVMDLLSYESFARYLKLHDRFNQVFHGADFVEWDRLDGLSFIFYFSECYPNFNQSGLNRNGINDDTDGDGDVIWNTVKLMETKYRKILQSIILDEFNLRYSRLQCSKTMDKSTYNKHISYRFRKVPYDLDSPVWCDCSSTDPEFFHNTHYRYFWILNILDLLKDKFQTQITSIRINLGNKFDKFENLDNTKRTYQEYSNYLKHFIELKNPKLKFNKLILRANDDHHQLIPRTKNNHNQSYENDSKGHWIDFQDQDFNRNTTNRYCDYRYYDRRFYNNHTYNNTSSSSSSTISTESKKLCNNRFCFRYTSRSFQIRHVFFKSHETKETRGRLSKIDLNLKKVTKSQIWKSLFKGEH